MRNERPCGASLDTTWLGVKKNTMFDWKAFSTSAAATPRAASPETIHNILMEAKEALLVIGMSAASAPRPIPTAAPTLAAGEGTTCDPLTGLFKRVHLEERLAAEFEQATQNRTPLSLIFADVDHLKQVNDLWGMEIGDHVMLALAHALAREGGGREHVARYGDHEMVLVLPRVKAAEAAAMAERIRQASATREYPIDEGQTMHISVSLGYATHLDATAFASAGELLEAARYALQSAKREGRNRVMAFTAPAFAPGTTRTRP